MEQNTLVPNAFSFRRVFVLLAATTAIAACDIQPQPLTDSELMSIAQGRLTDVVGDDQEPVSGSISLYEAMARALKYNLDRQVELKEEALRSRELRLSEYDLLPDLVAQAEYTDRDNDPGSRSVNLETDSTSSTATRSSERDELDGDLTLTWDVLDFGISYNRSKQRADDVLIALEQRRAATNRVIEDTRSAYWRAVSAQRLLGQIRTLKTQGDSALGRSSELVASEEADPRTQLEFQRDLLENQQTLEQLSRDLSIAKRQLAALMNLPIGSDFTVDMPNRGQHRSHLDMSRDDMILSAMINRPELREISYRQRRNEQEGPIATLEAIPGLQVFVGTNFSDNDLLENQEWVTTGARLSWNLMRLARLPERRRNIEAGGELLDTRALALTQAVATQVMVSRARYQSLHREYHAAERFRGVQRRLTQQVQREFNAGTATEQELMNERFEQLVAELRTDVAFADMQNAFANLYASMGLDSYDAELTGNEPVAEMADVLKGWWQARGDRTIN